MAASIRRVADAACSFATLVYPIISPLWPEALSEQRDRGAGPIPFRPKCSTIDYLGIANASAKPSDEMHSSVLETDFHILPHRPLDRRSERLATLGIGRPHA